MSPPTGELTASAAYTPFGGESKARFPGFTSVRWLRRASRLHAYAVLLNVTALVVLVALWVRGYRLPAWWAVAGLAAAAAAAERQNVAVARNIRTSVSFLPLVFSGIVFGPLAAAVIGAIANLGDLRDFNRYQQPHLRLAVYTPARALTGAAAGLAASFVGVSQGSAFVMVLMASAAAALGNHLADTGFNVLTLAARRASLPLRGYIRTVGPYLALSFPLYVPLIALLVYGYWTYSIWVVVALLAAGLALHRLLHLYQEQRDAAVELAQANQRLLDANTSFATALVATLDARDRYTAGHSEAVAIYARDIARRMGLPAQDQELAYLAGLVHDIGKIGLSPGLLEKVGPLTLEERRRMEGHSEIGERILANVADYREVARIVRHHHERVDGNGYPDKLRGDQIPLISRIIAVADAYDAMTSDRPYRDAMPPRVARLRLAQAVESQFDTSVVAAFEAILASAAIVATPCANGPEDVRDEQRLQVVVRA